MLERAKQLLKKYYGYAEFREGQTRIIQDILQGRDTVGIMPTGGGKSICFQIPALIFPGTTLVISPLISLMKDQVDSLNTLGIPATYINSSLSSREVWERLQAAGQGKYKLLYIAPERLESEQFRALLNNLPVAMLAVDEAHCVSHWGHDFRPSYLAIAELIHALPKRPLVTAFTATATEAVIKDIIKHLSLKEPSVYITGFDRENLSFAVKRGENKREFVLKYLAENREQAGIIYAATRKEVDNLYEFLHKKGFSVGRYHAGMGDVDRSSAQEAFLYDDIRVMVATNAFGMGIDKSNVRFVLHYNMPRNMESYYQEAGRAGRDGEPGECILLFSPQDTEVQRFLIEQTQFSPAKKKSEYAKLQGMVDYCHTPRCLRKYILEYFGEPKVMETCGNCGNCNDHSELRDITDLARKIFSCILRMRELFGITMVAEVLKGSNNKKVLQNHFNQLTTYGLLKEYSLKEITDLIKVLVAEGYILLSGGQYPVAKLQAKALTVLKNEEKVYQKVEIRPETGPSDNGLFEMLRRLRKQISQQLQVPPYVIFPDSTLMEMSRRLPRSEQALLNISGVGEAKLTRYGSRFLQAIGEYINEHPSVGESNSGDQFYNPNDDQNYEQIIAASDGRKGRTPSPLDKGQLSKGKEGEIPSHLVTLNLYSAGKTLAEIARERNLSLITVQGHFVRCHQDGYGVDWDAFITAGAEELVLAAITELGAEKLKPLKEALPEEIDYFTIRAVICKHNLVTEKVG